ncbi:hypothetical protein BTGOE4_36110 [Bacillus thuringiensis]|uniref:Uncharacterized protein n=1 Tax=Bacillus thuringiensis TaxID=1428 RepID=A0A9X5N2A1_BACTU|nr:hypothetical protein [Bacillus thuringiensis]OFC91913.1 hypothetical protein BTGOE4_36110 [Bacillus thuringiensis]
MDWISIFFDDKGVFLWTSMTAAVALFLGVINILISIMNNRKTLKMQKEMHKKNLEQQQSISQDNLNLQKEMNVSNFKGNIVSKSRIEWIQEVRKQSVAFISSFYNLINYVNELELDGFFDAPDHKTRIKKIKKNHDLMKLISTLKEKGTLLILYFGPDTSKNSNNEFINYMVTLIVDRVDGLGTSYDVKNVLEQEDNILSLKDFLRIYLKAEWKRANGELKDSDIQSYLENDDIYNHIIASYESGFESHIERIEYIYTMKRIEELRRNEL